MTDATRLSIVTVCYNSAHVIGGMLDGLQGLSGVRVIVVDNGSSDGSPQFIRSRYPWVEVIENRTNRGFAAAVNIGAECADGAAILLLNPDARIEPPSVEACLDELANRRGVGVIAPIVEQPFGRLATLEAGHEPNLWRVFTHWSGLSSASNRLPFLEGFYLRRSQDIVTRPVGWVSGSCMMVSLDVWRRVGGMTERYFMYAEDIDLCLRVRDLGFEIVLFAGATATHEIGGSSKGADAEESSPLKDAWFLNAFDLYRRRNQPSLLALWCWRLVFASGLLSRGLAYQARHLRGDSSADVNWRGEARRFQRSARVMLREPLSPPPAKETGGRSEGMI